MVCNWHIKYEGYTDTTSNPRRTEPSLYEEFVVCNQHGHMLMLAAPQGVEPWLTD